MPHNLERFKQHVWLVLSTAQDFAKCLYDTPIDTHHLLAGLLREKEIAGHILRELGLTNTRVETLITAPISPVDSPEPPLLTLSTHSKTAIQYAIPEAPRTQRHIDTKLLLLRIIQQPKCKAIAFFGHSGVTPDHIRHKLYITQFPSPARNAASEPPRPRPNKILPSDGIRLIEQVLIKALDILEHGRLTHRQTVKRFTILAFSMEPSSYVFLPISASFKGYFPLMPVVKMRLRISDGKTRKRTLCHLTGCKGRLIAF